MAQQPDGVTPLDVIGEVHCREGEGVREPRVILSRGSLGLRLDALVVKQLDLGVLAGNLFLFTNDIAV